MFEILVGGATIIVVPFVILAWWYAREDYFSKHPKPGRVVTEAPMPRRRWQFLEQWRFPALVLLGVIALISNWILLAVVFGWIGEQPKFAFSNKPATEIVQDRQFNNERVVIDGKSFRNGKFTNVTFVYNGTANFDLMNSNIYGSRWFSSDNPAIIGTVLLLKGIGFNPEVAELIAPPGIHVVPPKHVP
jgi:hypothetical protein